MAETSSGWTDEQKQSVIDEYQARNPTPETSLTIVEELAEEYDKSPNGVRMILTQAGVYVKKSAPAKGSSGSGEGNKRVSKQDALDDLRKALESAGEEVDEGIIEKLTGKAAVYFTGVINNLKSDD